MGSEGVDDGPRHRRLPTTDAEVGASVVQHGVGRDQGQSRVGLQGRHDLVDLLGAGPTVGVEKYQDVGGRGPGREIRRGTEASARTSEIPGVRAGTSHAVQAVGARGVVDDGHRHVSGEPVKDLLDVRRAVKGDDHDLVASCRHGV